MKQKDYYLLLGVNKRSSKEEIKQNYRKLAKKYLERRKTKKELSH